MQFLKDVNLKEVCISILISIVLFLLLKPFYVYNVSLVCGGSKEVFLYSTGSDLFRIRGCLYTSINQPFQNLVWDLLIYTLPWILAFCYYYYKTPNVKFDFKILPFGLILCGYLLFQVLYILYIYPGNLL